MATVFYIDWDNAQITGFSNTPGVGNLITLNTGGVTTRGLELSIDFALPRGLELGFDYAYADPRFRAGSDDLGSTRFCGLSATSTTSSFCVVGPARSATTGSAPLVPYVDGNRLQRTPSHSWRVALSAPAVAVGDGWELSGRIEGYGQDDVFDRAIGGARYGARTLLDARVGVAHGDWSFELWGLNLADEPYIAAAASRGAAYFPTTPRPLDLIHGPGRRFGITLRYGG
jgi:iron complex outermembrane receptor protein